MKQDSYYFDMNEHARERAVGFLLRSLLRSKLALLEPLDPVSHDEDVNIYLAHLMFAIATPEYHQVADRYLSPYNVEVEKMIEGADDAYIKYFIYKANADHLLIHLGIFQDLKDDAPRSHAMFQVNGGDYSGRATTYYDMAAQLNQRIYRKQTAVGTVLLKLSERFDRYCDILKATRRDFFHFTNTVSDEQFASFMRELDRFEHTALLKSKQDEFLDLYKAWSENKNAELFERLKNLSQEIRKLDPYSKFIFPE